MQTPSPEQKEINIEKEGPSNLPVEEKCEGSSLSIKQYIEALIFAVSEPISLKKIVELLNQIEPTSKEDVTAAIQSLQSQYDEQQSAFELTKIAGGYVLQTRPTYYKILELHFQKQPMQKLSQAAYEVLSIVAYRQPITRAEVDMIRGVDSTGPMSLLIERELIRMAGRKEVPGHPPLYATTKFFLELSGLESIKDLPDLKELKPKRRKKRPSTNKSTKPPKVEQKPKEINLTIHSS